jgi:Domain of Unknown Function (DUF1080)
MLAAMKVALALLSLTLISPALAADSDWVSLFNGRDLRGWTNANCAPETWTVRNGVIHCTGKPVGGLRTLRQYENFIMECEWRHLSSGGNSGVFVWGSPINATGVPFLRGIEVQVLDHGYAADFEKRSGKKPDWFTTHGDVFPIHGATMDPIGRSNGKRSFPSEERSKPSPEWNHYRIVANDGKIRLHVNGKEVSGGDNCNYRKGYLALESEGAPVEFRNLRIMELPGTGAGPDVTAPLDQGWRTLYNGVDLRGWTSKTLDRWQPSDWRLALKDGDGQPGEPLRCVEELKDFELVVDSKVPDRSKTMPAVLIRGTSIELPPAQTGRWVRDIITVKGGKATVTRDGATPREVELSAGEAPAVALPDLGKAVEFGNLYVRRL